MRGVEACGSPTCMHSMHGLWGERVNEAIYRRVYSELLCYCCKPPSMLRGPCSSTIKGHGSGKLNVDDYRLVKRFRAAAIALCHDACIDNRRLLGTDTSISISSARILRLGQIEQRLLLVA
jgi:hypothetical protein